MTYNFRYFPSLINTSINQIYLYQICYLLREEYLTWRELKNCQKLRLDKNSKKKTHVPKLCRLILTKIKYEYLNFNRIPLRIVSYHSLVFIHTKTQKHTRIWKWKQGVILLLANFFTVKDSECFDKNNSFIVKLCFPKIVSIRLFWYAILNIIYEFQLRLKVTG